MTRRRIRVTGLVQGVTYRASTQKQARALGLRGWVRNDPDGAVTIEAEGPPEDVDALVTWCRHGPPAARVDAVETDDIATRGDERDFVVTS